MIRDILIFLSIICCFFGCEGRKKEVTEETKILKVGTALDYRPFSYVENGKPAGFEMELVEAIAKELDLTLQVEDLNFETLIASLEGNRINIAISAISKTPEREERVDFSEPYYMSPTIAILDVDDASISLDDLSNNTIMVLFGTVQEKMIREKYLDIFRKSKIVALNKINELVKAYEGEKNATMILDAAVAKNLLENNPQLKVKHITIDNSGYDFAIALPKKSIIKGEPAVKVINRILEKFKEDGTMKRLKEKYNLS